MWYCVLVEHDRMSPEMVSSWRLRRASFPSEMCIDAYGLELVAIHLYGALCQSDTTNKGGIDALCETARKFPQISERIVAEDPSRGGVGAYNDAFRRRSQWIQRLSATLKARIAPPQKSLIRRQNQFVNVLSKHLVRIPRYKEEQTQYVRSNPSVCTSWKQWRRMVQMI